MRLLCFSWLKRGKTIARMCGLPKLGQGFLAGVFYWFDDLTSLLCIERDRCESARIDPKVDEIRIRYRSDSGAAASRVACFVQLRRCSE